MSETAPHPPAAAPPGWYPDANAGRLRWWDGTRWTEHLADGAPPGSPRSTDGFAIAALLLGIVGGILLSIPLAIVALRRIGRGETKGKGLAVAALAVSGVWLAIFSVGLVSELTRESNSERFSGEAGRVAAVVDAIEDAADDNDGRRFCARLTPAFAAALAERAGSCPKWLERELRGTTHQETLTARSISLVGARRATARVEEGDDDQHWTFERLGSEWRLAAIDAD